MLAVQLLPAMVSFRRYYVHIVMKNVQIATGVRRLRVGLPRVWKTCIRGKLRVVLHGQWAGTSKGAHRGCECPPRSEDEAAEHWSPPHVKALHKRGDARHFTQPMHQSLQEAILPSAG